jgi:hypothetical protein
VDTETDERIGVLCFGSESTHTTTATLRWLTQAADPPQRVLLITDERRRLAFGSQPSPKGKQYYDTLRNGQQGGFRHVELTLDEYAQLDAVVGLARSGDLELELAGPQPRFVTASEVIESHHRQGRYSALSIVRRLFPEDPVPPSDGRATPNNNGAEHPL